MLIKGMTPQEIRVLQEFRRLSTETLTVDAIKAIRHPIGGGETPAVTLVDKGYLTAAASHESFSLTDLGRDFLAIDAKPAVESPAGDDEADA